MSISSKQRFEIKKFLKDAGIGYVYRTYNKHSVTFWNVDVPVDFLTKIAWDLLNREGVHETKVITRMRNCSTSKEFYYGPVILRLTVEFYDY